MNDRVMKPPRLCMGILSMLLLCFAFTIGASAQGLIIEPPPPHIMPPPMPSQWLTLKDVDVQIDVAEQWATFHVTQVFHNNTDWDQEGTYLFPLPSDADISDFALYLDGKKLTAEVLDAAKARQTYEDIVRRMRDPGLLEYMGQGVIRCRIYPIPARGDKKVEVEYNQLLTRDGDMFKLHLPLDLSGFQNPRIGKLNIDADIKLKGLSNVYCPTHDARIEQDKGEAHVNLERSDYDAKRDFILYLISPAKEISIDFIAHESGNNEGTFLALLTAGISQGETQYIPKDFAFILDRSGSMSDGNKIDQAKEALKYIFRNLNDKDRFNLVTFASEVSPYNEGWQEVTSSRIADVLEFIDTISAGGGTAINDALQKVLDLQMSSTRPTYIIFLTDGLPTVGEQNIDNILANVLKKNEGRTRIFSYGVGYDLNFIFIDRLSKENGGFSTSVAPDENLEVSLSQFYGRIKTPVLTDCKVDFSGFRTDQVYPENLPDIFIGSQVALSGKYFGRLAGDITLSGNVGTERKTFRLPVDASGRNNPFVPRIWAKRRVAYLLNQVRMYNENQELVDEIVKLAKQYGILTPYTSYLVVEDIPFLPGAPPIPLIRGEGLSTYGLGGINAPSGAYDMSRGKQAAEASRALGEMEEGAALEDKGEAGVSEYVKEVGDKTFILKDNVWTDTEYDENKTYEQVEVEFLSDEYFSLIADNEDLAQYFSVGDEVIVVYDGKAYHVKPSQA